MNSRERLLAALNNEPVDAIPCSFMLFFNLYYRTNTYRFIETWKNYRSTFV